MRIGSELGRSLDQVGIDEEVFKPILRQDLFHAVAIESALWMHGRVAVHGHGVSPLTCRPIGALRYPDAVRRFAQMLFVRLHSSTHLRADRGIRAQQREVSVGGSAGEDLNGARIIEASEAGDDVSAQLAEMR